MLSHARTRTGQHTMARPTANAVGRLPDAMGVFWAYWGDGRGDGKEVEKVASDGRGSCGMGHFWGRGLASLGHGVTRRPLAGRSQWAQKA